MEIKKNKWVVAVNLRGHKIYTEHEDAIEVKSFIISEMDNADYNLANYAIYPPFANLTDKELVAYGIQYGSLRPASVISD